MSKQRLSPDAKTHLAVRETTKLLPGLTSYARAVSGNPKISLKLAAEGERNSNTLYIRPILALGERINHQPGNCNRTDDIGIQLCPACARHEIVMVSLYNEIGRLLANSNVVPRVGKVVTDPDIKESILDLTESKIKADRANHKAMSTSTPNFEAMASYYHEFLPTVYKIAEDKRVNEGLFSARPGVRRMAAAALRDVLERGYTDPATGSVFPYRDTDDNLQIVTALVVALNEADLEIDFEGMFMQHIVQDVHDEELLRLFDVPCNSAQDSFALSLRALHRLNEMGYLLSEEQEEEQDEEAGDDGDDSQEQADDADQSQPGQSGSGSGDSDGDDGDGSPSEGDDPDGGAPGSDSPDGDGQESPEGDDDDGGDSDGQGEPDDSSGDSKPDGESEPDNRGDNAPGKRAEDIASSMSEIMQIRAGEQDSRSGNETLTAAIEQSHDFDDISVNVPGFERVEYGSRDWLQRGETISVPEPVIGKALAHLRRVLEDNRRSHHVVNLKSGKVSASHLATRAPFQDPRMFKRKLVPGKKDYAVIIGLDLSGSTAAPAPGAQRDYSRGYESVLKVQLKVAYAQAEMLSRLGIPFSIYGHTTIGEDWKIGAFTVKGENDPWDTKHKTMLADLTPGNWNMDGHWMEFLRKRADESRATHKIIMYGSDGKMPVTNVEEETRILKDNIKICRDRGYTLIGLGIFTDSPRQHGLETVQLDSAEDTIKAVNFLKKFIS